MVVSRPLNLKNVPPVFRHPEASSVGSLIETMRDGTGLPEDRKAHVALPKGYSMIADRCGEANRL